jgi:hypothetical protein
MSHQAKWRDSILQKNAHKIRIRQDVRVNDASASPDVRLHRAERLRSPLMAQEHDQQIAHVPGALVFRQACAADDDDVNHFYPGV